MVLSVEDRLAIHELRVLSKGIGVNADGTCGTVTYEDFVRRVGGQWRIARCKVIARRTPLQP